MADALSRVAALHVPTIDYRKLAEVQSASAEIRDYRTAISGLELDDVSFESYGVGAKAVLKVQNSIKQTFFSK